ncbi:MAG: TonB-dependent receptor, partial [Myxococcota bacterium]
MLCLPARALAAPAGASTAESGSSSTPPDSNGPSPDISPPRLLAQVAPEYPAEALDSGSVAHGDVNLLVDVGADGQVTGVRVESGPEVFRESAMRAARQLRFAPATRIGPDGEPVPMATTTRLWFHFAPPDSVHRETPGDEVVVHAQNPDIEDTHSRTTLDEDAVERAAGDDLAETIDQVAGVRLAGGTADAAKPIIRGHRERRLLVLFDGVRHESQKWGPNHATEIDPFSAGTISVVRGAAGARYGPDAIGGVILVEPPPLRTAPGVGGKAVLAYASNGRRPFGAVRLDMAHKAWSARVEANGAAGATLTTPDYVLGNTASRTGNLGATLGYTWDGGQVRASFRRYALVAGAFYGVRNSTPTDFEAQLKEGRPASADLWSSTRSIDRPYQDVTHDVALLDANLAGSWGGLEATYALQVNRRKEFEPVREGVTGPQYDFTLRTHSLDAMYRHPEIYSRLGRFQGGVGVQGSFQENVYRGYALLPNYRAFGVGLFAYERLSLERVDLEVGGRVDGLTQTAFMRLDDYDRHVNRGTLDLASCTATVASARCPSAYETGSVSVGGLAHVVPDRLDLKLDLSTASRFPDADELYLMGNAPSFPVYAVGYPDLGAETAWGASLTAGLRHPALTAEVSAFGQHINDYIYFAPDMNEAGQPRFDVTINGTWPRYSYRPIDAISYGIDSTLSAGPQAVVGLDARASVVRIRDATSGEHLIGTPPDHLHVSLVGRLPSAGAFDGPELRVWTDLTARQSRVDVEADFAAAPPAYALLGASMDVVLNVGTELRIGAEARNLLNTRYREYVSLMRYYADQPGRDIR